MNIGLAKATLRESILQEALESILANTESGAISHVGHEGMTAYEALAKAVADCARSALQRAQDA